MDIKQLITLKTLSVEKNYLKASDKLNYAPSTLSKHIRTLEDELQVQLVEFRNNKIELTENGMKFMKYAEKFLTNTILFKENLWTRTTAIQLLILPEANLWWVLLLETFLHSWRAVARAL